MTMLADNWPDWASQETVIKCFKTCRVTTDQLDVELMQRKKFASADLVTQKETDDEANTPKTTAISKTWEAESPIEYTKCL